MAKFVGTDKKDVFDGTGRDDIAYGGGGKDELSGAKGADLLVGETGADRLDGGDGDDTLYAAAIDPNFFGLLSRGVSYDTGVEKDRLTGGAGNDYIFAGVGDTVDGGDYETYGNRLYISFLGATQGVNADFRPLQEGKVVTIAGATIQNIQNVGYLEGSAFDDQLAAIDTFYPSGANVYGRGGNDVMIADYYSGWGGSGLWGGDGDDLIDATGAQYGPVVYGEAGDDVLRLAPGLGDTADGGDGDDTIFAGGETHGGEGDDVITMQFTYYTGQVTGDGGDDLIRAASSGNRIDGGAGRDVLIGDTGVDYLVGGADNDSLKGGAGDDVLIGGTGRDILSGGLGSDSFIFEAGDLATRLDRADQIRDFSHAEHDAINLYMVDSDPSTGPIDHFTFIGTAAFSGAVGELRYEFAGGSTIVEGDTNGDGVGDVFLKLSGEVVLTGEDFLPNLDSAPGVTPGAGIAHPHAFDAQATGVVLA